MNVYPPSNPTTLGDIWIGNTKPTVEAIEHIQRLVAERVIDELRDVLFERRARTAWGDPTGDEIDRILGLAGDTPSPSWCLEKLRSMVDMTDPEDPIRKALTRTWLRAG